MAFPQQHTECPVCHHFNPPGSVRCERCDSQFSSEDDLTLTGGVTQGWSAPESDLQVPVRNLAPGTVVASRYEIIKLLGEGGMGAVYKAKDLELDRLVALKVIRPELAGHPAILKRFKQELILARQVTHKNVIRIFDLGVSDSLKFITMEFVEGRDLNDLLQERRFSVEESIEIIRQVCRALEAAHGESVIHRDLKPHNIMLSEGGKVSVMDFGLARSLDSTGITQTGAIMGTPAYMSPEQAQGHPIDGRTDIFSVGIIFYELLTGIVPFKADSMVASLMKRIQGSVQPPHEIDPAIPEPVSAVVLKCLAADPAQRYHNGAELLRDLENLAGNSTGTITAVSLTPASIPALSPSRPPTVESAARGPGLPSLSESNTWKWITAAVSLASVALSGFLVWERTHHKAAAPLKTVTVMIADISNHTGDQVFDGTLEPVLRLALEGASFINAYDRTQARNLGVKVDEGSGKLDARAATRIAVSQGLGVVVSGSLERRGTEFALSLKAMHPVTGEAIATGESTAAGKDQILYAVTKAATTLRQGLGDSGSESAQRFAMETLTATSLEAVHEYATAMDWLSRGKFDQARASFGKAADLDPNFGLAYAGKAVVSRNLGQLQEAEKDIRLAISHIDSMTERERYRTRAFLYLLTGDHQKCVEEYSALISRYASDVAAHNNLGICYSRLRNMPKATEEMQRATEILPKRALYRFNLAQYKSYAGDFAGSERELRVAQQLNPSFEKGQLTVAYVQLGQDQVAQAASTYRNLEKAGATGASLAAAGLADLAVYEGRYADAVRLLENAAAADTASRKPDAAADKFALLAYAQLLRNQKSAALAAIASAHANSKSVKIRFLTARTLVAAGELPRARALADSLAAELQIEPQAYAKLIAGEASLKQGDARQAVTQFREANQLLDTWFGRFDLGQAYLEAGAFAEADSEFERCFKRRGEAIELFMDDVPTYGYFPTLHYFQGRVREGLKSSGAAQSYRRYLSIRQKAGEDPLLSEVRRRLGQ